MSTLPLPTTTAAEINPAPTVIELEGRFKIIVTRKLVAMCSAYSSYLDTHTHTRTWNEEMCETTGDIDTESAHTHTHA